MRKKVITFLTAFGVFNYGLVLIYGLFLSVGIAGGWETAGQRNIILAACPFFLMVQTPCWLLLGVEVTKQLYPFIVHLPLLLLIVLVLKKPVRVALISVCTAYLCCQFPRIGNIAVTAVTGSALAGEVVYTALIIPVFLLLWCYFVPAANSIITDSSRSLPIFGILPAIYYLFDYATVIYTNLLYSNAKVVDELMPTVLILFYVMFLTAYRTQLQKNHQAEEQRSMLEMVLKQAEAEMSSLRQSQTQSAIYRHDMRHHLGMISSLLATGQADQANEYISGVMGKIEAITPVRFCENETVNLLCASYAGKAEQQNTRLTVEAKLPKYLPVADTEICSILSNGLENALRAVERLEPDRRKVELYCEMKENKLVLQIKNPYDGEVTMQDGLPLSARLGHGYGCRSIQSIARRRGGFCRFTAENGVFYLRLILP